MKKITNLIITALTVIMTLGLSPMPVWAYNSLANDSTASITTDEPSFNAGDFHVEGGEKGVDWSINTNDPHNTAIQINEIGNYKITGNGAKVDEYQINIFARGDVTLTLENVYINSTYAAININDGVHLTLNLVGDNKLIATNYWNAGIQFNKYNNSLIINGEKDATLYVQSGANGDAIGNGSSNYITVNSGNLTLTSPNNSFKAKKIQINGGTINCLNGKITGDDSIIIENGCVLGELSRPATNSNDEELMKLMLSNLENVNEIMVDGKSYTKTGNLSDNSKKDYFILYLTKEDHDVEAADQKYKIRYDGFNFTIKIIPTIIIDGETTKVYDGKPIELEVTTDTPLMNLEPQLTWYEWDNEQWNLLTTTPINAGHYKLEAVIKENDDFSESIESKEFVIKKAIPAAQNQLFEVEEGTSLLEIQLSEGYQWKESTTDISKPGVYTLIAIYTPKDTLNYEIVEIEMNVKVKEKIVNVSDVNEPQNDMTESIDEIPNNKNNEGNNLSQSLAHTTQEIVDTSDKNYIIVLSVISLLSFMSIIAMRKKNRCE